MNAIPTIIAVLPETPDNVPRYLTGCRHVITMMLGNPNFTAPTPPLAEVSADLDTVAVSEELALKGGKGMVQERDVNLRKAHGKMTVIRAYVQSIANGELERGEAIILSAGMKVGKPRSRNKLPVEAKHGNGRGRVVLDAKALPQPVQYRWQMSTDQMTWTDLAETFSTRTTVEDLVPATIYSFRLRTVTKNGPSEWSSPVTIIAH